MTNPTQLVDLESRWRPLTSTEQTVAESLLADAWAIVATRLPLISQWLTDGTVNEGAARAVVAAMVLRVLRNPDGRRSETIDDYSWTRDDAVSAGALYVSDDEVSMLRPVAQAGVAFTIRPA